MDTTIEPRNSRSRVQEYLRSFAHHWLPKVRDRVRTREELAQFYATRADYHAMTVGVDKLNHPQVKLLLGMIRPNDLCIEFGCGGGVAFSAVATRARSAIGLDIAAMGLIEARKRAKTGKAAVVQADVAKPPVRSGCADVAYSFEVLEHVWDPEAVVAEMIRVLKPGGLLFFTTPNGYSLDLHLPRKKVVKILDMAGAALVFLKSKLGSRAFSNMEPDLTATPAYPDCDMISTLIPSSLENLLKRLGCRVDRLETFFFQKDKARNEAESKRFERLDNHPFYRHFGDHILVVARKL